MKKLRKRPPLAGVETTPSSTTPTTPPAVVMQPTEPPRVDEYRPRADEKVMTPKQLADYLQVSPRTIRRKLQAGEIPCFKIGDQVRFFQGEVIQAIRRRKPQA
jgi:excisionase family DNA binding protein